MNKSSRSIEKQLVFNLHRCACQLMNSFFFPILETEFPFYSLRFPLNIVEISDVKFSKRWYSSQKIISFYMLLHTCFCCFSYPLHMLFTCFLLQSSNSMHWCQHLKGERRTEVSMKKMAIKDGGRQERYQRFTSEKNVSHCIRSRHNRWRKDEKISMQIFEGFCVLCKVTW